MDNKFTSQSPEKKGRWVGIAENVGDALTYKIITDDTNELIYRSAIRSALTTKVNKRLDPPSSGEEKKNKPIKEYVKSKYVKKDEVESRAPTIEPKDYDSLIGRTYLTDRDEEGRIFRAKVVKKIIEQDEKNHAEITKFLVSKDEDEVDEIMGYA